MVSNVRRQLENWLRTIDVRADLVWDVGGAAMPVEGRTKSWNVRNYCIIDISPEADMVFDINYPKYGGLKADIIFCLEVMEYVWNPIQALENMASLLKKDGILYISFHFIFQHHQPKTRDYLRYTRRGIEKLLEETGFKIIEITPRKTKFPELLEKWFLKENKVAYFPDEIGHLVKCQKI